MTYNAVLNDELVAQIWEHKRQGLGYVRISRLLGLKANTVKGVVGKRHWKHLMPDWAR
jgi:hypothetical protein